MGQVLEHTFIEILNMSLTASVIIAAVFVARIFLKRVPRIYTYVLWGIVLFRLLCPVSFEMDMSLLGILQSEHAIEGRMEYIPQDIGYQLEPEIRMPIEATNELINGSLPAGNSEGSVNPLQIWLYLGSRIWILGMAGMLLYSVASLWRLKKQLKSAVWVRDNIYRMPGYHSPFVYGIFGPCIYLPEHLEDTEMEYVLLHEQIHIKRGDHFWRMFAYVALCIHWFNPLVWAAFSFSGKDMEISCDEAVIRKLGNGVKKEYSSSLLNLACGDKIVKGIPVAFGESDTGSRIKHVLRYQKPVKIYVMIAVCTVLALAITLLANPTAGKYSVYGIIDSVGVVENGSLVQRIVRIPGNGDVLVPGSDKIVAYEDSENDNLEIGDLVKITFKEKAKIKEMDPGSYTEKAKKIEVLGKDYSLEALGEDMYRLAIPMTGIQIANPGYQLEFGKNEKVYGSYEIVWINEEKSHVYIEVASEELERVFRYIEDDISWWIKAQETADEADKEIIEEVKLNPDAPQDGSYSLNIRSVSRSAGCIDRYVADIDGEEMTELYFAENCVFQVNTSMSKVNYQEVSFEKFADYLKDKKDYTNAPSTVTFENGLITEVKLQSAFISYGISYRPFTDEEWSWNAVSEILDEAYGENRSKATGIYSTLQGEFAYDVSDREGEEVVEVYTGNAGDGNCGIVEFKISNGDVTIHTEFAHVSRAGWNNIYLGEAEGVKYILKLCIEDRDDSGVYDYQVFRLSEIGQMYKVPILGKKLGTGGILQIAGSEFQWGDNYLYDDELFKEWVSDLEYYLEHSFLILSSQNGEIRTEQVCELDKYNYETLKRE